MNRRDSVFCTKAGLALENQDVTAEVNSSSVDRKDTYATKFAVNVGTFTAGTFTAKLQHSDDDSIFTNCTDGETILDNGVEGNSVDLTASGSAQLGYVGLKRYVRVNLVPAGQSGTNNISVTTESKVDLFDPELPA